MQSKPPARNRFLKSCGIVLAIFGIIFVLCFIMSTIIQSSPSVKATRSSLALVSTAHAAATATEVSRPTSTPTQVILPSNTPTTTPTSTATPALTPTPTPVQGVVLPAIVNVKSGPANKYPNLARIKKGQQFSILGRSEDKKWVFIELEGIRGWVPISSNVAIDVSIESFDVSTEVIPTQTRTPTLTKTPKPTATRTPIPSYVDTPPKGTWCAQSSDKKVCVGGFEYRRYIGYNSASARSRFIVFGIGVGNFGLVDTTVSPFDVTLVMEDGSTYNHDTATYYFNNYFSTTTIAPGNNVKGALAFLVPNDVAPHKIIFQGGWFESDIVIDLRTPPE
jgi:hypothetical protein